MERCSIFKPQFLVFWCLVISLLERFFINPWPANLGFASPVLTHFLQINRVPFSLFVHRILKVRLVMAFLGG